MNIISTFDVVDNENKENWSGRISDFIDYGSFQRVIITARGSRLEVLSGTCDSYRWILLPELEIGCMQSSFDDIFWNSERLGYLLNRVDSLSVVYGIRYLYVGR